MTGSRRLRNSFGRIILPSSLGGRCGLRAYGAEAARVLSGASGPEDPGRRFGADLTGREVRRLMEREFARTAEDVLWRRSKLGLRVTEEEARALDDWMRDARGAHREAAE